MIKTVLGGLFLEGAIGYTPSGNGANENENKHVGDFLQFTSIMQKNSDPFFPFFEAEHQEDVVRWPSRFPPRGRSLFRFSTKF